jgi:signal transduction histidine kinase
VDEGTRFRPPLFDVGLVGALLVIGLIELSLQPRTVTGTFPREPDAGSAFLLLGLVLPLLWRRRWPVHVLVGSLVAYFVMLFSGSPPVEAVNVAEFVAVYSVGVYAARPAADVARVAAGLGVLAGLAWSHVLGRFSVGEITVMVLTWIGFAILGETVHARRRYQALLEERARRLEVERDERARLATQEERTRIAREFHDIWAHSLSVVVVQAAAAQEVFDDSPEEARAALGRIQQAARKALGEVRRLIGTDAELPGAERLAPAPGLRDLDRLVEELGSAGVPVDLSVSGALDDVPSDVGLSAYRIVQQALTNTLSHGGRGVTARVDVRRLEGELVIDVVDDGRGGAAPDPERRGRGVLGMRERAALFGGDVEAGPRAEGGYAVHARIPLRAPA